MVVIANQMGMFGYALRHPIASANQYLANDAGLTCLTLACKLGMISHKKSLITIFGHKHKITNFIKKFDIFHEKISTASDFGSYFVSNFKF